MFLLGDRTGSPSSGGRFTNKTVPAAGERPGLVTNLIPAPTACSTAPGDMGPRKLLHPNLIAGLDRWIPHIRFAAGLGHRRADWHPKISPDLVFA